MCASTQVCVGTPRRSTTSCSTRSTAATEDTDSLTGLTPMSASPQPCRSPSSVETSTPSTASVGWLGWTRQPRTPRSPIVLRRRVIVRSGAAPTMRSLLLMSLATAAAISGVSAQASPSSHTRANPRESTISRSSPTVTERRSEKRSRSCPASMSAVTSSSTSGVSAISPSVTSASAILAATRSSSEPAASPASWSPDFSSLALASSVRRSANRNVSPRRLARKLIPVPKRARAPRAIDTRSGTDRTGGPGSSFRPAPGRVSVQLRPRRNHCASTAPTRR